MTFAVHISDGVLSSTWVVVGWLGAALLVFLGARRVRDDEIPRIALLTAAFFVASSIHVPLGPTSAHLLLNGLLGVVLGWRAALAILIGLTMQKALLVHGGWSTIGINCCVQTLPALAVGPLFSLLRRWPGAQRKGWHFALVTGSAAILIVTMVCVAHALYRKLVLGAVVWTDGMPTVGAWHAVVVLAALLVGAVLAGLEQRLEHGPEFYLGLLVGELSVLLTVLLHATVLILGGEHDWETWALFGVLIHLPIAVVEGVVVGFTVSFMARVKPEMLGSLPERRAVAVQAPVDSLPVVALAFLLIVPTAAEAHALEAEAVARPGWQVQVESWFETGEAPNGARVEVFSKSGQLLTEGRTNARGIFLFTNHDPGPLRVVVSAGAGHRAETSVTAAALSRTALGTIVAVLAPTPAPFLRAALVTPAPDVEITPVDVAPVVERSAGPKWKNLLLGVAGLLGVAALATMWQRLRAPKSTES